MLDSSHKSKLKILSRNNADYKQRIFSYVQFGFPRPDNSSEIFKQVKKLILGQMKARIGKKEVKGADKDRSREWEARGRELIANCEKQGAKR